LLGSLAQGWNIRGGFGGNCRDFTGFDGLGKGEVLFYNWKRTDGDGKQTGPGMLPPAFTFLT
jgi:hypothetical protein